MAAALPVAAIALQAGSKILGGFQQAKGPRAAAAVDEQNAQLTLLDGEQQVLQTRRDERQQAGDMIAMQGGSGIEIGSGSAGDLIAESAYQRELEILNIRTKATRQANNLYQDAADKRAAARAAILNGVFGAVASVVSSAADLRASRTLSAQSGTEDSVMLGGGAQASSAAVPPMRVKGPYM